MNPARLLLQEGKDGQYSGSWMFPVNAAGLPAEVSFTDCKEIQRNLPTIKGKYLVTNLEIECDVTLKGKEIAFKGLTRLTDALVSIKFSDDSSFEGLASINNSKFDVPEQVSIYPVSYFWLGIEHLLSGIDHMLFVFGLLFLVSGAINLIKTITAFTIAHSITLAFSVFDLVSVPQASTEAFIALTIVYLALEVGDEEKYETTPWLIAFGFGLLHGLGFAGALSEIGINNDSLLLSLLFFNIGIEAGQLLVLPFFGLVIYLLKTDMFKIEVNSFASYLIGGLG
ncbi:MAG: HupE/UreJ protein, partial [Gammaproteobacteria bacterium]|nr:HupE/UreJ protein [Gammaproteobacteria bacterium]